MTSAAHPLIARLTEKAEVYFAASNDKKAPQWSRKANVHAWAGMVNAIHIVEAWLIDGSPDTPASGRASTPASRDGSEINDLNEGKP